MRSYRSTVQAHSGPQSPALTTRHEHIYVVPIVWYFAGWEQGYEKAKRI